MSSNLQKQLELKSKSLDDREQSIVERERALDDTERLKKLDVLDKQLVAKQEQNDRLDATLADKETALTALQKRYNDQAVRSERESEQLQNKLTQLQDELGIVTSNIEAHTTELASIKNDIKEQTSYLHVQEEVVENTIAELNVQINELHQEGELVLGRKQEFDVAIVRSEQRKNEVAQEVQAIEAKLEKLETVYTSKVNAMKDQLASYKSDIQAKENELAVLVSKQTAYVENLKTREHAILIQEAAITQRELDLQNKEQRLNMKLGLTNVVL